MDSLAENDDRLAALVRNGDGAAFTTLYRRHVAAVERYAEAVLDNPSDVDDVVAEAFTTVWRRLVGGNGPASFFRTYVLDIVRRMARVRNRLGAQCDLTADPSLLRTDASGTDPIVTMVETDTVVAAFRSLPPRWQAALWNVEVEGLKPAAASARLGISPNAVSTLTRRARDGFRTAYLQSHVSLTDCKECALHARQLGAYARYGLARSSRERVRAHLEECPTCTAVVADLRKLRIPGFPAGQ